ncbi:hypothetical protein [Mycolicibacterium sp.]|uniref:hypothetical protein n=1 Tax=Mycolicibacterium sp. TaxID=2320850 RepID=UPI0035601D72
MSFDAAIDEHPVSDAPPFWESLGHRTFDDALRCAEEHIHAARPGDRLVGGCAGDGQCASWSVVAASGEKVATLTITRQD